MSPENYTHEQPQVILEGGNQASPYAPGAPNAIPRPVDNLDVPEFVNQGPRRMTARDALDVPPTSTATEASLSGDANTAQLENYVEPGAMLDNPYVGKRENTLDAPEEQDSNPETRRSSADRVRKLGRNALLYCGVSVISVANLINAGVQNGKGAVVTSLAAGGVAGIGSLVAMKLAKRRNH